MQTQNQNLAPQSPSSAALSENDFPLASVRPDLPAAGIAAHQRDWMRVNLDLRAAPGGAQMLSVRFRCDHDRPRPACCNLLPDFLCRLGFYPGDPDWEESGEVFCPTSFFSAQALVTASKVYSRSGSEQIVHDTEKIWEYLGSLDLVN